MKRLLSTLIVFCLLLLVACKNENKETEEPVQSAPPEKSAPIKASEDQVLVRLMPFGDQPAMGKVSITESNGIVTLSASMVGLNPGSHSIRLYQRTDKGALPEEVDPKNWNPDLGPDGEWELPEDLNIADSSNFEADEKGNANVEITNEQWCLGCDDPQRNIIGKAIIVVQGTSDTNSSADADLASRLTCGGIIQQ